MGRATKVVLGITTLLATSTCFAGWGQWSDWNEGWGGFKPNVGIDIAANKQMFYSGFGKEQFRRVNPLTNLYVGAMLHQFIGVELGYEHMHRQNRFQAYPAGSTVLGFFEPGISDVFAQTYFSNTTKKGWHADVVGYWPICKGSEMTLSVGATRARMFYETLGLSASGDDPFATSVASWRSNSRTLWRLGIGYRQMVTEYFGARVQAVWENTRRLRASTFVPGPLGDGTLANLYTARPGNSYYLSAGLFFQIP